VDSYIRPELLSVAELKAQIKSSRDELDAADLRLLSSIEDQQRHAELGHSDSVTALTEEIDLLEYQLEEIDQTIETLTMILSARKSKSVRESQIEEKIESDLINVALSDKLLRRLHNISDNDLAQSKSASRIRIYVLQVKPVKPIRLAFSFYVGSTGHPIERRIAQHINLEKLAWKKLKNGSHEITRPRSDLFDHIPEFSSERAAHKAEGMVADFLNRRGFPAYSDQALDIFKR
jgi:hypothetical protein